MNVLVFGLSQIHGGVESVIINYCNAIKKFHPDTVFDFIVIDKVPDFAYKSLPPDSGFFEIPARTRKPLTYKSEFNKIMNDKKYDVLWSNFCTLSDITIMKCAYEKIPIRIIHSHNSKNMGNSFNGYLHNSHKKITEKLATNKLACSKKAAEFFDYSGKANSWIIVNNSIDTERFSFSEIARTRLREKYGWNNDFLICNVGRFHLQKNHSTLVDIFFEFQKTKPEARLILIGEGELKEEIYSKVSLLGISEKVFFAGSIDNVNEFLSAADVFLFPSLFEGFPLATLEAQSCGLPCIVSSTIPKEIALIPEIVRFVSLDSSPVKWCETIQDVSSTSFNRKAEAESVKLSGYDINNNAEMLYNLFRGN